MLKCWRNSRERRPGQLRWVSILAFSMTLPRLFGANEPAERFSRFDSRAFAALPIEEPYTFSKLLARGADPELGHRDPHAKLAPDEMEIPATGWSLWIRETAGVPLKQAAEELRSYLVTAMQTHIRIRGQASLVGYERQTKVIVAGVRKQLPGCGESLQKSKDYQIIATSSRIVICGFDEAGAMYGIYNLEERFSLREAPYLPRHLSTVRHSLYRSRMTLSGLGWMEWPDNYLRMLARYGFDSIYTSDYANPNGVSAPAPFYNKMRRTDPAALRDLINRCARYGIKLYCPILFNYTGTAESEAKLRALVRDIVTKFPEIRGYVLLTEGFDAGTLPWDSRDKHRWIKDWANAVRIAEEECHKINPAIEILPWDYNINFRPNQVALKQYVIDQLPKHSIPLITFENGKSFTFDGETSYLKDYAISQTGPSEVAVGQISEAHKLGLPVYAKADTWASWQFGTFPYLPFPYQWYARYKALEKYEIDGVMESWTYGFKPNFVAELRAWYSWSDAPPLDVLLRSVARRDFGPGSENLVLRAWKHFSAAIRLDPDTGPTVGGNNAVADPFFFEKPEPGAFTFEHSFWDQKRWSEHSFLNPYWPYVFRGYMDGYVLYPDFTNHKNVAEEYARPLSLPVFRKYLLLAAGEMEKGLSSYRQAALNAPSSKSRQAFRKVLLAEQIERMMRSNEAMLTFEDLRFHLAKTQDGLTQRRILSQMKAILSEEIGRTQAEWETAQRDSRLGYEWEEDYLYSPHTIEEKLLMLQKCLKQQIPSYQTRHGIR